MNVFDHTPGHDRSRREGVTYNAVLHQLQHLLLQKPVRFILSDCTEIMPAVALWMVIIMQITTKVVVGHT